MRNSFLIPMQTPCSMEQAKILISMQTECSMERKTTFVLSVDDPISIESGLANGVGKSTAKPLVVE